MTNNQNEMFRLAFQDETTGLNNKNFYFHIRKDLAIQMIKDLLDTKKEDKNRVWSVLFCDANNLKYVNDNFGHEIGGQGLKSLGEIIKRTIRTERQPSDSVIESIREEIPIRFGGDEFLIILPACRKENAFLVKERIKKVIADSLGYTRGLSLAIGISDTSEVKLPNQIDNEEEIIKFLEQLISMAEDNMYEDKSEDIKGLTLEEQVQVISKNISRLGNIGIDYHNPDHIKLLIDILKEYQSGLDEKIK